MGLSDKVQIVLFVVALLSVLSTGIIYGFDLDDDIRGTKFERILKILNICSIISSVLLAMMITYMLYNHCKKTRQLQRTFTYTNKAVTSDTQV